MKNLINKRFTFLDLAKESGASMETYNLFKDTHNLLRRASPLTIKSGRTNYIFFQDAICALSNGHFINGGQGKGRPDFYYKNCWCETKAFEKDTMATDYSFHVAASSFFANNCKAVPHKKLIKEGKAAKAKRFLFEHSYSKNEFYLLTSTAKLNCSFEEVEMMFITVDVLKKCLSKEKDFKEVSMEKLQKMVAQYE